MVLIESYLMDVDCESFLESLEGIEDCIGYFWFQDGFSIFDRELDVVVALGDVVIPPPEITVDVWHNSGIVGCLLCVF